MSTLTEIEQAGEVLPIERKRKLVAFLLTALRKDGGKMPAASISDEAVRASLLPLAATAWSQDWDVHEEDDAWRDL